LASCGVVPNAVNYLILSSLLAGNVEQIANKSSVAIQPIRRSHKMDLQMLMIRCWMDISEINNRCSISQKHEHLASNSLMVRRNAVNGKPGTYDL
jgi:hypothetical protein